MSSKTRYMVLNHYTDKCKHASTSDVRDHIAGNCASPISTPVRRQHPSYRPINKASDDPHLPSTPKRGSRNPSPKKSGSQSPVKRSAATYETSSAWQGSGPLLDQANSDEPIESFIHIQDAQKAMANFRNAAETRGSCCAISGIGEGWVNGMVVGPGIHACHIIPQSAWDLYPLPGDEDGEDSSLNSPRRWQKKWESTWAGENAIWMQSSIHDAHDGRILAIHPKTWKIRSFAPYNLTLAYHNAVAHLSVDYPPDHRALRYHWESCVIENITAKNPWRTPAPPPFKNPSECQAIDNDGGPLPTKRQRTVNTTTLPEGQTADTSSLVDSNTQLLKMDAFADHINVASPPNQSLPELDMPSLDTTPHSNESFDSIKSTEMPDGTDAGLPKKRCLSIDESYKVNAESYITPGNAKFFLADVNWELKRQRHG